MKVRHIITLLVFLCGVMKSPAQNNIDNPLIFPTGLSVEIGVGKFAMRDEYISKQKYSGQLPHFKIAWSKFHHNYTYFLDLAFQGSSNIDNYNVSSEVIQFSIKQGFLYPVGQIPLFKGGMQVLLGPTMDFYLFYNKPDIALAEIDDDWESTAILISGGIDSRFIYPIKSNLQIESALGFNILSLGIRTTDDQFDDESPAKLLTPFRGINGLVQGGIRWFPVKLLSLKIAYQLQVCRITSWTPLSLTCNNLNLTLTYGILKQKKDEK